MGSFSGKAVIVSAPSGAGKTTIVKNLLESGLSLGFSVSATSRPMRPGEIDGKDYYFLSAPEFRSKVEKDEFLEWEEVYENQFYGTLKIEIDRLWTQNLHVIFDVDVKGGFNIKKYFGEKALSLFIAPPSIEVLEQRLRNRGTETSETLRKRLARASFELSFADKADVVVVNDHLEKALKESLEAVKRFLNPN